MDRTLSAAEKLATALLREALLPAERIGAPQLRDKWAQRFVEHVDDASTQQIKRMGQHELSALAAVAEMAYLVGLAVGQRLRPNAFVDTKGGE